MELHRIIHNLEYAAFNLCEKTDSDVEQGVIESTCPETSLLLAIRELKQERDKNIAQCEYCDCDHDTRVACPDYIARDKQPPSPPTKQEQED
jgi:hypothetical protein